MLHIPDGFLIALEGIDGSGKTTLVSHLARLLVEKNVPVVTTREPGQAALGVKIRELIQQNMPICSKAEYLLFAVNRAQHYDEYILPQLCEGKLVISDRLFDSSLVYQGYARGMEKTMLHTINGWVSSGRMPDLVVYVRISPALAAARIQKRAQQLSIYEHAAFIAKVFQGYEELVAPRSDVFVVDGNSDPEQLARTTADHIYAMICQKYGMGLPCTQ